jgi:hypothetical protein
MVLCKFSLLFCKIDLDLLQLVSFQWVSIEWYFRLLHAMKITAVFSQEAWTTTPLEMV